MLHSVLILLHLLGFAAFLGGAFAQQEFMKRSGKAGITTAVRDEYERLSAAIATKIEVPGTFAQVVTGVVIVITQPYFLKEHWLHAKLTAVVLLLVLSHLEMFNARNIVKARARGDAANDEIAARKKRHAAMGAVGTVLVVAVLLFVTVLRGMF